MKNAYCEASNNGYSLKIKKIPAETNVAEWIKEDAGTGASMESGNHIWGPNWADLIKAQDVNSIALSSMTLILKFMT